MSASRPMAVASNEEAIQTVLPTMVANVGYLMLDASLAAEYLLCYDLRGFD
jgi:hypothetical protein